MQVNPVLDSASVSSREKKGIVFLSRILKLLLLSIFLSFSSFLSFYVLKQSLIGYFICFAFLHSVKAFSERTWVQRRSTFSYSLRHHLATAKFTFLSLLQNAFLPRSSGWHRPLQGAIRFSAISLNPSAWFLHCMLRLHFKEPCCLFYLCSKPGPVVRADGHT